MRTKITRTSEQPPSPMIRQTTLFPFGAQRICRRPGSHTAAVLQ
ncbi:hypothetical protein [Thermosporothrix hazakensis]|nr:hypothetical protein [Thermosporothrix hazakensis]